MPTKKGPDVKEMVIEANKYLKQKINPPRNYRNESQLGTLEQHRSRNYPTINNFLRKLYLQQNPATPTTFKTQKINYLQNYTVIVAQPQKEK